jgi:type I restriction enzyme M protein
MVQNSNGANLGFEQKLWKAADKLRSNMDAAEYKHVVLGLIFLKYISDSFEEKHKQLLKDKEADPEDKDEYLAENIFWVPSKTRWEFLQKNAKQPTIGKLIDDAMDAIEKDNPSLKGVLPKDYARPALDKQRLGEIIDLIGTIGLGDNESKNKDILGRVYEYFLGQFASEEGRKGGQFYTPKSIVKLLVEMIEPYKGRVYDPCCGSGGMFVQSEKFVQAHEGTIGNISIYGQESNPTTWRLCKMNLAIRGIDANIQREDSFLNDLHRDLKADFILANPPFNDSDWKGELLREDIRWNYGTPPLGNANFAWVQHFIYHLSPNGIAGFVLANVSLTSTSGGEEEIRRKIIEDDLIDCVIVLPDRLFYSTGIPACLWFITRNKNNYKYRNRKGEILLINAKEKGKLVSRKHRELTDDDIREITNTYHNWKNKNGDYKDIIGFCKSVKVEEIIGYKSKLIPGLYVGIKPRPEDNEDSEEKLKRISSELLEVQKKSLELDDKIKSNFKKYNYTLKDSQFLLISNSIIQDIMMTLFKFWFLDYNFPNENDKPYLKNGGKMIETKIGSIPKGWRLGFFGDVAIDVSIPVRPEDKKRFDKYISLEDIPRKQIFINRYSSIKTVNSSMIEFRKGDILFGSMRPYFHKVCIAPFDGITRTTTFVIRPKEVEYQLSLLLLCFQKYTIDFADYTSEGSTIPYAVFETLQRMPIVIPPKAIASKFQTLISPLIEKGIINTVENLKLITKEIVDDEE